MFESRKTKDFINAVSETAADITITGMRLGQIALTYIDDKQQLESKLAKAEADAKVARNTAGATEANVYRQLQEQEAKYDTRVRQAQQQLDERLQGYKTLVESVMSVVMPSKPVEIDANAVHGFMAESQDKGYNAFKAAFLTSAMEYGKNGKTSLSEWPIWDDAAVGRKREDIVAERGYMHAEGVTLKMNALRQTNVSSSYLVADTFARSEPFHSKTETSSCGQPEARIIFAATDKYNKTSAPKQKEGNMDVTILGSSDDVWAQRIIAEAQDVAQAMAYGAFTHFVEADNLQMAARVYNTHLKDVQSPQVLAELAKVVEAKPQMVRYMQPTIDALAGRTE